MSRLGWNVVRVCILLMAGPPIGLLVLVCQFPDTFVTMPVWLNVSFVLGIPASWLVCMCVAAYFIPPQRAGIGTYYLIRHWTRW